MMNLLSGELLGWVVGAVGALVLGALAYFRGKKAEQNRHNKERLDSLKTKDDIRRQVSGESSDSKREELSKWGK